MRLGRAIVAALIPVVVGSLSVPAFAQSAFFSGTVSDSSGQPLAGALVRVLGPDGHARGSVYTEASGRYRVGPLAPGDYTLEFSFFGSAARRTAVLALAAGQTRVLDMTLAAREVREEPVVVSVSRLREKSLDAPASVSVVGEKEIRERPALTVVDHVRQLAGVDVSAKGVAQENLVVRGFSSTQSGDLLVLVDNRTSGVPSLRYNLFHFLPTSDEDLERIEVVRGPAAAVYGPDSDRGVLHLLTRSPFESQGTSVALAGGERGLAQGELRHARVLSDRFAFKVSVQGLRADDWQFVDSAEVASRQEALAQGADPETLRIGRRDRQVERLAGEVRADWRVGSHATLIGSAGMNQAFRNVDLTPIGAAQVRDWRSSFAQARFIDRRLFAQAYVNWSDAGDTYLLRTGQRIVDDSRSIVAQVQHGFDIAARHSLTYGLDFERTEPRTSGTITGRNEADDVIQEAGGYAQSDFRLDPRWDVVAALRLDAHSRFDSPVLSPRAGVVYKPQAGHSLRLTYNRAFGTPSTNDLFLDVVADSLPFGLPYAVRAEGVPESGYHFVRDSAGEPLMRSPFNDPSNGGAAVFLPSDATLVWNVVAAYAQSQFGCDFSAVPPPDASQVGSVLKAVDAETRSFQPIPGSQVADVDALRPRITNTLEAGYKGRVAGRLNLAVDGYWSRVNNFIGALRVATPNVFFDEASLATYLSNYMPPLVAQYCAAVLAAIPVGTISPREARDPTDILFTVRNFGDVTLWGADLSLDWSLPRGFSVAGSYSWVSDDFFAMQSQGGDVALNATRNKGSLSLRYRNDRARVFSEVRGRGVASFPVISGVFVGRVQSYALLDASLGYRVRSRHDVLVTLSAQNLLDHRHQEFLGAPRIGRLVMARLRIGF